MVTDMYDVHDHLGKVSTANADYWRERQNLEARRATRPKRTTQTEAAAKKEDDDWYESLDGKAWTAKYPDEEL